MLNTGDTAWLLLCTALVLLMTPGLAFFYGGLVRSKNVLGMLMQVFACIAVVSMTWTAVGFSLAFGKGDGFIGGLRFAGLSHLDANVTTAVPGYHLAVPPLAFVTFQLMFAIITAALIAGASADRLKLSSFVTFIALWSLVVYAPIAHWVFSPEGWLNRLGLLDFAGGTVVEINCGMAGLALALVAGARRGWPKEAMVPHSLPLTLIGAGLLWFGWFGFNAGSALAADGLATQALIGTHLAACAGLIGWLAIERWRTGHATTLGGASGAIAGLVAITPSAGYVNSGGAILIGVAAGVAAYFAVHLKFRFRYDDSLDVVGVHFVGGVVGTCLIGLLASAAVNPLVHHRGLLLGGGAQLLGRQLLGIVVTAAYAFVVSLALALLVKRTIGLRVTEEQEYAGLDQALHAEVAYDYSELRTTRLR